MPGFVVDACIVQDVNLAINDKEGKNRTSTAFPASSVHVVLESKHGAFPYHICWNTDLYQDHLFIHLP